jgi:hypothetical protein
MAALVAAIHVLLANEGRRKTWMPGMKPGMTRKPRSPRGVLAAMFGFARLCPDMNCRRARCCVGGDKPVCFDVLWPQVAERDKIAVRVMFQERHKGASPVAAVAAGEAAAARWEADNAPRIESHIPAPEREAAESQATPRVSPSPRVRLL